MRSFTFCVLALVAVNVVADTLVQYPIATVEESVQAGVFGNRQPIFRRPQAPAPQPGVPEADGNRTAPVDPANPPKFDAAPNGDKLPLNLAELTPEQKQQLFTAISSIVSLLIGAFAGSGKMG